MEYNYFYLAAFLLAKKWIIREEFILNWKNAQSQQGIKPKVLNRDGTKWVEAK